VIPIADYRDLDVRMSCGFHRRGDLDVLFTPPAE
jgi:hypothetical protein